MAKAIWWLDMISAVSQLTTGLYLSALFSDIISPLMLWCIDATVIIAVVLQVRVLATAVSLDVFVGLPILNITNLRLTLTTLSLFCWSLLGVKLA